MNPYKENRLIFLGVQNSAKKLAETFGKKEKNILTTKESKEKADSEPSAQEDIIKEEDVERLVDRAKQEIETSFLSEKSKEQMLKSLDKLLKRQGREVKEKETRTKEELVDLLKETGDQLISFKEEPEVQKIYGPLSKLFQNKEAYLKATNLVQYGFEETGKKGYWNTIQEELTTMGITRDDVRLIQEILGLKNDGKIGPKTIGSTWEMLTGEKKDIKNAIKQKGETEKANMDIVRAILEKDAGREKAARAEQEKVSDSDKNKQDKKHTEVGPEVVLKAPYQLARELFHYMKGAPNVAGEHDLINGYFQALYLPEAGSEKEFILLTYDKNTGRKELQISIDNPEYYRKLISANKVEGFISEFPNIPENTKEEIRLAFEEGSPGETLEKLKTPAELEAEAKQYFERGAYGAAIGTYEEAAYAYRKAGDIKNEKRVVRAMYEIETDGAFKGDQNYDGSFEEYYSQAYPYSLPAIDLENKSPSREEMEEAMAKKAPFMNASKLKKIKFNEDEKWTDGIIATYEQGDSSVEIEYENDFGTVLFIREIKGPASDIVSNLVKEGESNKFLHHTIWVNEGISREAFKQELGEKAEQEPKSTTGPLPPEQTENSEIKEPSPEEMAEIMETKFGKILGIKKEWARYSEMVGSPVYNESSQEVEIKYPEEATGMLGQVTLSYSLATQEKGLAFLGDMESIIRGDGQQEMIDAWESINGKTYGETESKLYKMKKSDREAEKAKLERGKEIEEQIKRGELTEITAEEKDLLLKVLQKYSIPDEVSQRDLTLRANFDVAKRLKEDPTEISVDKVMGKIIKPGKNANVIEKGNYELITTLGKTRIKELKERGITTITAPRPHDGDIVYNSYTGLRVFVNGSERIIKIKSS
jgi:hypothetical protein